MKRTVLLAAAALALAVSDLSAEAACSRLAGAQQKTPSALPFLEGRTPIQSPGDGSPIVGLWHVVYTTSDGQFFLESFDQWHSDGTEFEVANAAPAQGNVCQGVWVATGGRSVQLAHIGWTFNADGSSAGTFTLNESNTVKSDGSAYKGPFDYKQFDVGGNLIFEATGTLRAQRITAN